MPIQIRPHSSRIFRQFPLLPSLRPRHQPLFERRLCYAGGSSLHGSAHPSRLDARHLDRIAARHGWLLISIFAPHAVFCISSS
jgi:hypothetical protein